MTVDAERALDYCGGQLDRKGALRSDERWLAEVIPMWRGQCLVGGEPARPLGLTPTGAGAALADADVVFLGLDGGSGVFAVDLSHLAEGEALAVTGASRVMDLRALVPTLDTAEAATQAHARGILHWHRHQRFCGSCGSRTVARDGGSARVCASTECQRLLFPRIEPAVIMLVEAPDEPDRCLLARHRGSATGGFSLLAGFVEIGESLENAVRREVFEEAGVPVGAVTYLASQSWPFPAGLMVGFRARATGVDIRVDHDELVEARWFTRAEIRARVAAGERLGRPDSIDRIMLGSWLAEGDRAHVGAR
jgi:NAD+ diphosphatase